MKSQNFFGERADLIQSSMRTIPRAPAPDSGIFVCGAEETWSTAEDKVFYLKALRELGLPIARSILNADCILFISWYVLQSQRYRWLRKVFRRKRFFALLTSDPKADEASFLATAGIADRYVCVNRVQMDHLGALGMMNRVLYNPIYVDEKQFAPLALDRREICRRLGIEASLLGDRLLIGSFQRDSLGKDLSRPKWQKGPTMLLDILSHLDRNRYLLVLAGPRRHFVVNRCRELRIPYLFVGDEKPINDCIDDFGTHGNIRSSSELALLYNLIDLYLVTSNSEGGPKAVLEAPLCHTPVLSTDVGMSRDVLTPYSIYRSQDEAIRKILELCCQPELRSSLINDNFQKVFALNHWAAFTQRVGAMFCDVQ
jgi:glycosyltransferase involved in cell wall biosynthesis